MRRTNLRLTVAALVCAITLLIGTAGSALAANNNQTGLVNVNVQGLALAVPVSVAVPIGVAANVCPTVNAALLAAAINQTGTASCDAKNTSTALSRAIGTAAVGP